jgi:transcriptional regulator with XRE-family HTH domain
VTTLLDRRHALGLRQRDLAAAAGISSCALSYLEREKAWHCGPPALALVETALKRLERTARKRQNERERRRT